MRVAMRGLTTADDITCERGGMAARVAALSAAVVGGGVVIYYLLTRRSKQEIAAPPQAQPQTESKTSESETTAPPQAQPQTESKTSESKPTATTLSDYTDAFTGTYAADAFLTYYALGPVKKLIITKYTRGEFYELALRAAKVLSDNKIARGECHTHFFSCNTVGDLVFRLASVLLGTTPVTINWQADDTDKVLYKIELTSSKLVLIDPETPAETVASVRAAHPSLAIFNVADLPTIPPCAPAVLERAAAAAALTPDAARIIIFTSGTTGNPKGVRLSYRAYTCNRRTFEDFLQAGDGKQLVAVTVNPLHHTNSTSITDWAMRKPGAQIHLIERYTTSYWPIVARAGTGIPMDQSVTDYELSEAIARRDAAAGTVVVAPLVSRHIDILDSLIGVSGLPMTPSVLKTALKGTLLLLGSAPVGPTTVDRLGRYAGRLPTVRFGSTETCLQVMGTPTYLTEAERLAAFQAGWQHAYKGQEQVGYYIGRPHPPYTECRVVRATDPNDANFLIECADGEPGQLITRGDNLMSGYVGNDQATAKALTKEGGWYVNLGDIVFRLASPSDGAYDYYWLSRDSALLIRGGANYAYEQVNAELKAFAQSAFGLGASDLDVGVVGMRLDSEHEDSCCVTLELLTPAATAKQAQMERDFLSLAKKAVSKGAKPDHVRCAPLPRNFKGTVKLPDLKEEWAKVMASRKQ